MGLRRSNTTMRLARRALCAGIAASFGATVLAQSAPFTAIHGSATMNVTGNLTTITTVNGAGGRSVLNWPSFGVPDGKTVHFAQPDALSTSINRVTGGNPSAIFGTLSSNGQLVLVNPAGITVGKGAVVDTAGFTASTLGISRDNAIAGRLLFGSGDLGDFRRTDGDLAVQGQAQVLARNGDVVLIGRDIQADAGALLQASGGDVVLAAGHAVEVTGRGLEGIQMQVRAPGDRAVNLGTLRGDSVAIFAGQLHHSGLIQANSATAVGGKVVLQATDHAELAGGIQASTANRGGSVLVTADQLVLKSATVIDVSHAAGGGEILVGGGLEGQDPRLSNARDVEVEKGVLLRADATLAGNGGTVVTWSNGDLDFHGGILARGAGGGIGGIVEVSARGRIRFDGTVDVNGDGASGAGSRDPKGGSGPGDAGGSGKSGGSGDSGDSGKSDKSGKSGDPKGPGNSGSGSGKSADSGNSGSSGRGSSGTRVPRVPLAGQSTEVRSGASGTEGETDKFIAVSGKLLDPGEDDFAALQPASDDSDARVLGAGPGESRRKGKDRDLIVTDNQCRSGS